MVVAFNNRWCTSAIIEFLRIPNRVCQRTTRSLHVQVMHTVGWCICILRVQALTTINLFRNVQVEHCYNTTNDIHCLYKHVKHKNNWQ